MICSNIIKLWGLDLLKFYNFLSCFYGQIHNKKQLMEALDYLSLSFNRDIIIVVRKAWNQKPEAVITFRKLNISEKQIKAIKTQDCP